MDKINLNHYSFPCANEEYKNMANSVLQHYKTIGATQSEAISSLAVALSLLLSHNLDQRSALNKADRVAIQVRENIIKLKSQKQW